MYVEALFEPDISSQRITAKNSTTLRRDFELGLISALTFSKENVIELYFGSLAYVDRNRKWRKAKTYRDKVMKVAPKASL